MLDTIAPGSRIRVEVIQTPKRSAAAKTLVRLLSKDDHIKQDNQRLAKIRRSHLRPKRRGGRIWRVQMVKLRPVKGQAGDQGTITASIDVLRDLGSVQRFVHIEPQDAAV